MLTPKDVADITGIHVKSVRRMCRDGKTPSIRFGQKIMIPKDIFKESLNTGGDKASQEQ